MQTSHLIQSDDFSNISAQKHFEESAAREYLNSLIINRTEGWHKKQQFDFLRRETLSSPESPLISDSRLLPVS